MIDDRHVRQLAGQACLNSSSGRDAPHGPQRERGLWSFLTWSFFLSQIAAGTMFIGNAAKAGGDPDVGSSNDSPNTSSASTGALPAVDSRPMSVEESQLGEAKSSAPVAATGSVHDAKGADRDSADITFDTATGFAHPDESGRANVAFAASPAPDDADGGAIAPAIDVAIDPALSLVDSVLPPVIDMVGDLLQDIGPVLNDILVPVVETADDLLNALSPTIDQLLTPIEAVVETAINTLEPTIDQLLIPVADLTTSISELPALNQTTATIMQINNDVLDAAAPLIEPATEIIGHLPIDIGNTGLPDGILGNSIETNVVASSGEMHFSVAATSSGNDLFHAGTYTDYSLALHDASTLGEPGSIGGPIENIALPISTLIDSESDDVGHGLPVTLAGLHTEYGLRGIGDGLM